VANSHPRLELLADFMSRNEVPQGLFHGEPAPDLVDGLEITTMCHAHQNDDSRLRSRKYIDTSCGTTFQFASCRTFFY